MHFVRFDGSKLRDLRKARGFDQHDLGTAARKHGSGVNQSQISRYENGAAEPSGRTAIALATALGVSPSDLYGLDDDEEEAALLPMTREEQEVLVALFTRLAARMVKS